MISEIIEKWIKGILIDGITGNLSGLFDNVNAKVGEIASDVGSTPQAWNSGIFNMLRSLSETVVLPIGVRCPLRKERLNGVCDRSQRFDPCKIQSLIRADQAAAGLLRRCAFNGRTALFFGPELSFQQCSGPADDFCHAAGAAVRSVRAARPAP